MKKTLLIGLMAGVCSTGAMASDVNNANITTFTANTAAQAAQVNANFAEVIAAINDNAARIAALEAGTGPDLLTLVKGSTYRIFFSGNIVGVHTDGTTGGEYGFLDYWNGSVNVTLNDDGTGSDGTATINYLAESKLDQSLDRYESCDDMGQNCTNTFGHTTITDPPYAGAGSWTLTGSTLEIVFPDDVEPAPFTVTPDGQLIIESDSGINQEATGTGTLNEFETKIAIGIKIAP